jgi:hypothetical protein
MDQAKAVSIEEKLMSVKNNLAAILIKVGYHDEVLRVEGEILKMGLHSAQRAVLFSSEASDSLGLILSSILHDNESLKRENEELLVMLGEQENGTPP